MLINFSLMPIEKIQPWGKAGDYRLSWFGLTDGMYWIQAGNSTLFEYSELARAAGSSRYCDYQVVRLYEDLMDMLPSILEPIPVAFVRYIAGESAAAWRETYGNWCDRNADSTDDDGFFRIVESASTWTGRRRLDTAYLSPSTNIVIWSDTESIHFEWDNRKNYFDGKPAWSALHGTYQITRETFMEEIRSFHVRLMAQMSERVKQVISGALSPGIKIDLPGLTREHDQRSRILDEVLSSPVSTDWQEVGRSILAVLNT